MSTFVRLALLRRLWKVDKFNKSQFHNSVWKDAVLYFPKFLQQNDGGVNWTEWIQLPSSSVEIHYFVTVQIFDAVFFRAVERIVKQNTIVPPCLRVIRSLPIVVTWNRRTLYITWYSCNKHKYGKVHHHHHVPEGSGFSLLLNPQDEVDPSICFLVVLCFCVISVYTVVLVLVYGKV
jgi:hypothetical protein